MYVFMFDFKLLLAGGDIKQVSRRVRASVLLSVLVMGVCVGRTKCLCKITTAEFGAIVVVVCFR